LRGRVRERVDWRKRWKNGNVMYAVIFTILRRATRMGIFPRTHPLINSLILGSVPYAALPKICLKRFNITLLTSTLI
jgi:hypothetical protein